MPSRAGSQPNPPSDSAATFVEALLALSLLSVVCGGASGAAGTVARAVERVGRLTVEDRGLVRVNALLRDNVSRVRFPPRAAAPAVERSDGGVRLWYLDGDADRHLDLFFQHRQLVVSDGFTTMRAGGFASVSLGFLWDGEPSTAATSVPVVCARLESAGGERVSIYAHVGRWPLPPVPTEVGPTR